MTAPVLENPLGVVTKVIPGGRYTVFCHFGSHDRIGDTAFYLYRQRMPHSGEDLRDFPLFLHYLNLMPETLAHELVTDLYLPLK